MSRALGVPVEQHDDGSRPGMHDLDIMYPDRPTAAAEVTAAADSMLTEQWNLMNDGGRWQVATLTGGWLVSVEPEARVRRLRRDLPEFLRSLEEAGIRNFRVGSLYPNAFEEAAKRLKVVDAFQGGTDFPGSIYLIPELPLERVAGNVAETGDALAEWITEFLGGSGCADVRRKLARSAAAETHTFVILAGFSAPFAVTDLLLRPDAPLPIIDPKLPDEISEVWAVSSWSTGIGFRWSEAYGWQKFDKSDSSDSRSR
jgi:hypothetical protein